MYTALVKLDDCSYPKPSLLVSASSKERFPTMACVKFHANQDFMSILILAFIVPKS